MQAIRRRHESGDDPLTVVRDITGATDRLILAILHDQLNRRLNLEELPLNLLLVAQGGYGRREMHPRSDVDILFLYHNHLTDEQSELIKALFRNLYDLGFMVGHCCRSFRDALEMAASDSHSQTAIFESRLLSGDWRLFEAFKDQFWRSERRRRNEYIQRKIEERKQRLARYGGAINITEPNIKESPGGLRDYHFGLWMGSLHQGRTLKLLHMKRAHLIDDEMMRRVERAIAFLWRLRTDLHFLTGKEQDVLAMPIQHEVSQRLGYVDREERIAEESMMRDYFGHAYHLRVFADHMESIAQPTSFWNFIKLKPRRSLTDGFFIQNNEIQTPPNIHFFEHNPRRLLQVFIHMAIHETPLSTDTRNAILDNLELIDEAFLRDRQTAALFHRFFSLTCNIEEAVQAMRETGVLERIFPEWRDISRLVRYDLAHKFTVDEHSLLCLYHLEHLEDAPLSFSRERALLWKQCKDRDVLRLAVLFHDIGKGRNADHSVVGAKLADEMALRFSLPDEKRDQLVFLVRHHLLMSRTAQRRDLTDPDVTADFCDAFNRPEDLDMLYLLSFVDIQSVSNESMSEWKNNLLWQLYASARDFFYGEEISEEEHRRRMMSRKEKLIEEFKGEFDADFVQNHLDLLPASYMMHQSPAIIRGHLRLISTFDGATTVTEILPHIDSRCRELLLVTQDRVGLFHSICTAVMLENFTIVEARLNTRSDGIVANNIIIRNDIAESQITPAREMLLRDRLSLPPKSVDAPQKSFNLFGAPKLGRNRFENQVKILNDISARFTVIEIHGPDRRGLLQSLSSALSSMNININFARIITQGNRVTDILYVTDSQGEKIDDEAALPALKDALKKLLD